MLNQIVLEKIVNNNKQPDSGRTVEVYNHHASDTPGSSPNGSKLGNAAEISVTGVYTYDLSDSKKTTIVVDGLAMAGLVGVLLDGEKALDGSVDTTAMANASVTPIKTTFVGDF